MPDCRPGRLSSRRPRRVRDSAEPAAAPPNLAREQRRITADDILRAAGTAEDMDGAPAVGSTLLNKVVMPALGQAEHAFSDALARINVEDLAHSAAALRKSAGEG